MCAPVRYSEPQIATNERFDMTAQLFSDNQSETSQAPTAVTPGGDANEPQVSLQDVTPELAEKLLDANTRNRRLRPKLVEQYTRDMAAGRWQRNFEPVQIAESGVLLNGQHRLAAISESGVTQQMLVVTGLADDVQDTIDVGSKRSPADQLSFRGFTRGTTLSAAARLALQVRYGKIYVPTQPELLSVVNQDAALQWVVEEVLPTLPKIAQPAVLAYSYLRFHHIDPAAAKEFFEHLSTLSNLPDGSPILALHRRFTVGEPIRSTTKGRLFAVTIFMTAWNAWRNGESRSQVRPRVRQDGDYNIPEPV